NTTTPTFQWNFSDNNAGNYQTKYQIEVDTYSGHISDWSRTVWSSGIVTSSNNSAVCINILSRWNKYIWRVRTWDNYGETSPWTSGADTFWVNRIIIGDVSIADWFGATCADTDKSSGEPILSEVQKEHKTDGGKFYWRDSIPPYPDGAGGYVSGSQGDVSVRGSYTLDDEGRVDLDSFVLTADYNNLYVMMRFVDLDDALGVMAQIAIDYEDGGELYFKWGGVATKDCVVTNTNKWDKLIRVCNADNSVVVTDKTTWSDTSVETNYYNPYSEHIGDNWIEFYVPFELIGGREKYLGQSINIAVTVCQANGANAIQDFNDVAGAPVMTDAISKRIWNFNGLSYDPAVHEFTGGQIDSILNTYVNLKFNDAGNFGEVTSVSVVSGKNIDGSLNDWMSTEILEIDNGDTAYVSWEPENLYFAVNGFDLTGTNKIMIAVSTNDETGVFDNNLGGPNFDTPYYGPNYIIYIDDASTVMYHSASGGIFGAGTNKSAAAGWAVSVNGDKFEIQIPRSEFGSLTTTAQWSLWIACFTGNQIVNAYPLTNPQGADSGSITFIGHYFLRASSADYYAQLCIDNTPPVVNITSISSVDSASVLGSANATVSLPNFDDGNFGDSFGVTGSITESGSGLAYKKVIWLWNSTDNSEDTSDIDSDSNGSFTIVSGVNDLSGNDTIILSVSARDRQGNIGADTVYIQIDNTNPDSLGIISPANGSETLGTNSIIYFDWADANDTHSGIRKYYIQIDTSSSFLNPHFQGFTDSSVSDTYFDFSNKIYTTYYWRYYALDNAGNTSGWSSADSFIYTIWQKKTSPAELLQGISSSSIAFGDYDNDGDQDFVIAGNDGTNKRLIIFKNNGNFSFTNVLEPLGINAGLAFGYGAVSFGDYDNDGDLDLAVTGSMDNGTTNRFIIYKNIGNDSFINIAEPLGSGVGIHSGCVRWGDLDNDGDMDIAIIGGRNSVNSITNFIIYRNDGNDIFSKAAEPLGVNTGLYSGNLSFGDYDNDGDLDIGICGWMASGAGQRFRIYRNDGNFSFTNYTEPMGANVGLGGSNLKWADFNNDGYLDIGIVGYYPAGNYRFIIYTNNKNNTFSSDTQPLGTNKGIEMANLSLSDYDNDGDVDIAAIGHDGTFYRFYVFINNNGTFVKNYLHLDSYYNAGAGSVNWIDLNNDGNLDLVLTGVGNSSISKFAIFANIKIDQTNIRPSIPLLSVASGQSFSPDTVIFQWQNVLTDTTVSNSMNYNLRIGTTAGGCQVIGVDTNSTHSAGNSILGNVQNGTSAYILGLPGGTYYWAVQAVDGGQMKSEWSEERSFTMAPRIKITSFSTGYETCVQIITIS
ncbi:MAG TPA: VCBS repeat-containing protein, partial [bacterium]|nr:VCBS repeat-containing protein [bacterium]